MVKKNLKNIIASNTTVFDYPIIVNSYGRSGSTVLTKSIVENSSKAKHDFLKEIIFRSTLQTVWELDFSVLKEGVVYKTHDYPPPGGIDRKIKMLYTFADPVDVVLSLLRLYDVRGEEWMKEHYQHLKVPYNSFYDIVHQDQLKLGNHLNSWLDENRFPIAFIRYRAMWDHQEDISEFLGFNVKLPPYRERKASNEKKSEVVPKIKRTYKSLRRRINKLDDFFVIN